LGALWLNGYRDHIPKGHGFLSVQWEFFWLLRLNVVGFFKKSENFGGSGQIASESLYNEYHKEIKQ